MKIKLIENVFEHNRFDKPVGLKVTQRKKTKLIEAEVEGKKTIVAVPDPIVIPWVKGTVMEVSVDTGAKLIERKQAEVFTEKDTNDSDSLETPNADSSATSS